MVLDRGGDKGNQRLPLHGNILIPAPKEMPSLPFWGFRASGLLPNRLMDGVLQALAEAEDAGCVPFINPLKKAQAVARKRERDGLPPLPTESGAARSNVDEPFHIGVFKHPSHIFDQPWVTKDTLQGLRGDGPTRKARLAKMMALCQSLDNLANGRVQRMVGHMFPALLDRYREFARLRSTSNDIVTHDMTLQPLPFDLTQSQDDHWPFLRYGNLGTTVALGRGGSEKLHVDSNDSDELPTVLMILGAEGEDWDHSERRGDLLLPTLGLSAPLYAGDVFLFFSSLLPHQVKMLKPEDRHKRTVATRYTCSPTQRHLEGHRSSKEQRRREMQHRKRKRDA